MSEKMNPKDLEELINQVSQKVSSKILKTITANALADRQSKELLNSREAAKFLNISLFSIYAMVNRCKIPATKRGSRLYFSPDDLMEYSKKQGKRSKHEMQKDWFDSYQDVDDFLVKELDKIGEDFPVLNEEIPSENTIEAIKKLIDKSNARTRQDNIIP